MDNVTTQCSVSCGDVCESIFGLFVTCHRLIFCYNFALLDPGAENVSFSED